MAGTPSPNSLLNDLRTIQFPPAGGAARQPGINLGGGAFAGQVPGRPNTASAAVGALGGISMGGPSDMGGMGMGGMGMPSGMGMGMGGGMMAGGMGGGMGSPPMGTPPLGGVPGAMGMGGMGMGGPPMGGAMPPLAGAQAEPPEDLSCSAGTRAPAWGAAKQHFRSIFGQGKSVPLLASKEAMGAAMENALKDLKNMEALGPKAVDECGLGKLCLQMLSFASIDDPAAIVQLFSGLEQLASPVLTLLLDVPWVALAGAGWPFFGLLSQLNLRRGHLTGALNNDAVDGLDDPVAKAYQAELNAAIAVNDFAVLEKASSAFLQKDTKGSALGPLTALAAQAAAGAQRQERLAILQGLQAGFRQVIGSAAELDIALGTQWPLWGLLHAAVEGLSLR